ncbi:5-deoxy-glucuronate isomerase [Acetobacter sp. AN02]|uniref:5-deoxy-glucuronate isomerase n=1 Tax=Acetobacter sp. AN02 TaxID=2894186 RepID=UPI00243446A1|nr:5-deoxy-glucuronate isomerase [Acetobacter sp. AN02]MDG6095778.1 5-deoxy-glucuronate isomerase [Acetobacter sp. AN02]
MSGAAGQQQRVRIGANPIIWTSDDLPSIGGGISLEECLDQARRAGVEGMELGHKFPSDTEGMKAALAPYGLAFISGWWSLELLSRTAEEEIEAETAVEVAVCRSPAEGRYPARAILPDEVGAITRGESTNQRFIRNILPDTAPGETLLVVEVITPGGHWSSYPPHKHDTDDFPNETYLEETYYHRLRRGSGFALQRVYTKDGSLDDTNRFLIRLTGYPLG